jgi:hypothetical protein
VAKAKPLLDAAMLGRCFDGYVEAIHLMDDLRTRNDMAMHLQNTKLPPKCTEALLRDLIVAGIVLPELGPISNAVAGTMQADVVVYGGRESNVEVKATAANYTALSGKDVLADYFVWMDFGTFIADGMILIYTVRGPVGERFGWTQGMDLHKGPFILITEGQRGEVRFDFRAWLIAATRLS